MSTQEKRQEEMNVAFTIINQMGSGQFKAMIGVKQFIALEIKGNQNGGVRFKIGRNKTSANYCDIILDSSDTYTMRFFRVSTKNFEIKQIDINVESGLYDDMIRQHFTDVTGLYTRL